MPTTEEPLWESTTVQNLIRYRPSGTYFARFKVGGKLVRQSLETAVFSVAKQRLPDKIRDYRSRHESVKAFAGGKLSVRDAVEVYRGKVRANASLKPRSKDYREMTLDFIQRSWPSLFETDVRKVSERDCENWLTRFQQQYACRRSFWNQFGKMPLLRAISCKQRRGAQQLVSLYRVAPPARLCLEAVFCTPLGQISESCGNGNIMVIIMNL